MTDQSGEGDTRRAAGWLTLNTGSRAVAGVAPSQVPDPAVPGTLSKLRNSNVAARFHSRIGALGDALHRAGLRVAAVGGAGAVLGGMSSRGTVDSTDSSVGAALDHADVVLVEVPDLYGIDRRQPGPLRQALGRVDAGVAAVVRDLPPGVSLLVAGVSDGLGGHAHLHVAMASGAAFGSGQLSSASTGRVGVVQLIDVAPTVLRLTGVPVPSAMVGQPWATVPGTHRATARQVSLFVDLDNRSIAQIDTQSWFFYGVLCLAALFCVGTLQAWRRGRTGLPPVAGAVVAAVPAASWLAQVVPWWRAGFWPLGPLTAAFALAIGWLVTVVPWRRPEPWRTAGLLGAVSALVIVVDVVAGSPLSLDAPFGDNPIIAGRFHGVGNIAFAVLAAGSLCLAAAVAVGLRRGRASAAVLVFGAVAVVVDGYPGLGDDFGGVLALVPPVALLGLIVSRTRIAWPQVFAVIGVTVATVGAFAVYDYSRPAAVQTHVGRFVGQLADGTAWPVIGRKLGSSLGTFTGGPSRWVVFVWLLFAVAAWVGHRRGRLRLRAELDRRVLGGLVAALITVAVLGATLNDSGLAITAFVLYVATPVLVPFLQPTARASGRPASETPGAADRAGAVPSH